MNKQESRIREGKVHKAHVFSCPLCDKSPSPVKVVTHHCSTCGFCMKHHSTEEAMAVHAQVKNYE